MEFDEDVAMAAKAYEKLENIHSAWIKHISSLQEKFNVGEVRVENNEAVVQTLGQTVHSTHRPIQIEGYLRVIEYAFRIHEDDPQPLYVMYLRAKGDSNQGRFYTAPTNGDSLYDSTNTYIASHLINSIASKLLTSSAFEAHKLKENP